MLSEDQISQMLNSIETDHTMSDAERSRIQNVLAERLEQPRRQNVVSEGARAPVLDLPLTSRPPKQPLWARPLIATIALAVVLAIGALTTLKNQQVVTAGQPETATTTTVNHAAEAGQAFCAGPFLDFSEAIFIWDGIRNWSFLTDARNPEPHLPSLALTTLDQLMLLRSDPALIEASTTLEQAIAAAESQGLTPENRSQMETALSTAVGAVATILQDDLDRGSNRFASCDFTSFTVDG